MLELYTIKSNTTMCWRDIECKCIVNEYRDEDGAVFVVRIAADVLPYPDENADRLI